MNDVKIKLIGVSNKVKPIVMIDGQRVNYKKNEFEGYDLNYQTEKEEIEVEIYRYLELKGKLWWLYALISFIVSVFGIFEPPYDKKCIVIDCKYTFKLQEQNDIKIRFQTLKSEGKCVEVETNLEMQELKNSYYVDKDLKKRWAIILAFKIVCWVLILVLVIILISKLI